ncbi:MAG: hypothetical protein MRK00_16310 [Nitrosomonas sp.]|nr:hypothetical protein [Nitrosomonas sp.]
MTDMPKQHEMPELLVCIADTTAKTLRECTGLDEQTAGHIGHEVAISFAKVYAKQVVYVPSAENFLKHSRDEEIWSEFNGSNHNDLARKYNISAQWVYKIIKKMQLIKSKEVQGNLFEDI